MDGEGLHGPGLGDIGGAQPQGRGSFGDQHCHDRFDGRLDRDLCLGLGLADRTESFGGHGQYEIVRPGSRNQLGGDRPGPVVDRPVAPPRPHFIGHERNERREQPKHHIEGQLQRRLR